MHIPDGFLSTEIWVLMYALTLVVLAYATKKVNKKLGDKHVPLMGVLAAFVFAAQMLNVPIAAGTSGHMLGGVLIAVFIGPYAASLVMASIFFVQSVFFQDGGLTALGANIFNMGLIGAVLGYFIYVAVRKALKGHRGRFIALGISAWLAVVLAAIATTIELAFSGTVDLALALPAMVSVHAIIGVVEALITVAVVAFVLKTRPDLLELEKI